ncbi:P-loop NTPase fold protein [Planococcus liqunii]|uniref:P-loop NTPase fold protein n=1 Tax=Planococcus liqunii TaxID=3058394 RepID=UPI002620A7CA|nr:P-loop NTPase fold protein [Planococcus sp. N056]WKA50206.1 P-loop NTPase fold protein [Planococcus sp. N056]
MDKYLSMIMDYINRSNTDYSLLLSGDWGNGKTHFITTAVFPKLQEEGKKPIRKTRVPVYGKIPLIHNNCMKKMPHFKIAPLCKKRFRLFTTIA